MPGDHNRMELSIDTSTRYAAVALSSQGEVVREMSWRSAQNHSVEVVPAAQRLLEQADCTMEEIDAIFVARGPGGFSALRVGLSVGKSLAMARNIPLVAVGTLELEARPYLGLGLPVCALIEAGRSRVYTAMFGDHAGPDAIFGVETHEELVSSAQRRTLFCGEGAVAISAMLRERLGSLAVVAGMPSPTRRPAVLAGIGYMRLQASETDDPASLQPLYMRGGQFQNAQRKAKEAR